MPAPATASAEEIRSVNTRYHDGAAAGYDAKWGIDYGEVGRQQVLSKVAKALGGARRFERSLEIGAGTGYFSLNMLQAGVVGDAVCTDISPGMLDALQANARAPRPRRRRPSPATPRSCRSRTTPSTSSSATPCCTTCPTSTAPSASSAACCAPAGGCSSPASPRATATASPRSPSARRTYVAPLWRRLMRAAPAADGHSDGGEANHQLEALVDVHAFTPDELSAVAGRAGLPDVRVRGEELLANWFGWANRALEATADPETVPWGWKVYAFKGYLAFQEVDRRLLEPRLPPAIFYNLILSARNPGS